MIKCAFSSYITGRLFPERVSAQRQKAVYPLMKAGPAPLLCDECGQMIDELAIIGNARHSDAQGEIREHRFIIRRVAEEDDALRIIISEALGKKEFAHLQLGIDAHPGVDVNGAHLRGRPLFDADPLDPLRCFQRKFRLLFGEIDRQIEEPGKLILSDAGLGNLGENPVFDL